MISFKQEPMDSSDARILLSELNNMLVKITGDDGTEHFNIEDINNERSCFIVGYQDNIPYCCGAIRQLDDKCAELKRIYARKNNQHLGSKLINELEQQAINLGYEKLLLETRIQNERAISFYKHNGYCQCSSYGVYRNNTSAYCMEKLLK